MKILRILSIAVGLLFIQTAAAQNPAISTLYSNEELAQKVKTHKASHSRDVVPPTNIRQKFQSDFPKSSDVEWEASDSVYEVEFDVRFRDCEAYYDVNGNLLMTVEEMYRSELPAVVKNAAETKYPKFHFEDIDKIRRGTEVFYKIEMERRDVEVELLIRSDGIICDERIDY
jgi:hypothetical protein